jgi:hypothetical protein
MSYNVKNYTEQGGEKTVIGGILEIKEGATVTGITATAAPASAAALGGIKAAASGEGDTVEVKINTASSKLYVPTYPMLPEEATVEVAGIVKQATNVAEVEEAPTADDFNALLDALITAGIMAAE